MLKESSVFVFLNTWYRNILQNNFYSRVIIGRILSYNVVRHVTVSLSLRVKIPYFPKNILAYIHGIQIKFPIIISPYTQINIPIPFSEIRPYCALLLAYIMYAFVYINYKIASTIATRICILSTVHWMLCVL